MAKLYFRYSSMGAGKTLDLLKVSYNYEERGRKPLLLTSAFDDRFEVGLIKSRTGLEKRATLIKPDTNLFDLIKQNKDIDCVLIDEAQFLTKEQVLQLTDVVDHLKIPVICYGLRVDYMGEPFEGSSYLMARAHTIEEIKTICHCGKKATMNARVEDGKVIYSGDQILIDKPTENSFYTAVCSYHWKTGEFERPLR